MDIKTAGATFRLGPVVELDGGTGIAVGVDSVGVSASGQVEIYEWSGGLATLCQYFDRLAADWSGWHGARDWRDDSGTVTLRAIHNRMNEVLLSVALNPATSDERDGAWVVTVHLGVEPGALKGIASDLRALLEGHVAR